MKIFLMIIIPLSAFAVLFLLASYFAYRHLFGRDERREPTLLKGLDGELTAELKRKRELILKLNERPFKTVKVKSADGVSLRAEYYEGEKGSPVAIGFHGYRSSAVRDLAGLTELFLERGFSVLLVYQRAHGKSGGKAITFSALERLDALEWARFAEGELSANKIILFGMSMGGATVISASELPLPEAVKGIIADCPFSRARGVIHSVCRQRGIPYRLLLPLMLVGARLYGGFTLGKRDPVRAISSARVPILLIHGEGDTFVPHSMSDELSEAGADLDYVKIKDAPHLLSLMYDEEKYTASLDKFLNKILK